MKLRIDVVLQMSAAASVLLTSTALAAGQEGWYVTATGYHTEIREADNKDYRLIESCDPLLGCSYSISRRDFDGSFASEENVGLSVGYDHRGPLRTEIELREFENRQDRRRYSDGSSDAGGGTELDTRSLAFNFWYDFNDLGHLRPYVGLGVGFADVEYSGVDDQLIFGQMGAGITWHVADRLALEAGYRYTLADDPEYESRRRLVVSDYSADSYLIGVRYSFFNAAEVGGGDGDGDGIADRADRCPGTPRAVVTDGRGCPLDSDNDGVADYLDSCPDSKAGDEVDVIGCPGR